MKGQLGFFDLDERYAQLSKSGDRLERLFEAVGHLEKPPLCRRFLIH